MNKQDKTIHVSQITFAEIFVIAKAVEAQHARFLKKEPQLSRFKSVCLTIATLEDLNARDMIATPAHIMASVLNQVEY